MRFGIKISFMLQVVKLLFTVYNQQLLDKARLFIILFKLAPVVKFDLALI